MSGTKLTAVFGLVGIISLLLLKAGDCLQQNKLLMLVTLGTYSASDNDYYDCVDKKNYTMCGYQLEVEAFSDGVPLGRTLWQKQTYAEEFKFPLRQETGLMNPVQFGMLEYPRDNVSVRLTMHYYSKAGVKVNRVFRAQVSRLPVAIGTEIFEDSEDVTLTGEFFSSLSINIKFVCHANFQGNFCDRPVTAKTTTTTATITVQMPVAASTPTTARPIRPSALTTTTTAKPTTGTNKSTGAEILTSSPANAILESTTTSKLEEFLTKIMVASAVVVLFLLAVALAVGLGVKCARSGKRRRDSGSAIAANGRRPDLLNGGGGGSCGGVWYPNQPQQHHPFNGELVQFDNNGGAGGTFGNGGGRPALTVYPATLSRAPPPPAPLLDPEGRWLPHRGSCSGSSGICCSASTGQPAGVGYLEPLRQPDGEEQHGECQLPCCNTGCGGTLPLINPPNEFATNTVGRPSQQLRVVGTGGRRNVLEVKSFQC